MRQKTVRVGVKRLAGAVGLELPRYQSDGAAGLDLVAAVPADAPLLLEPGAREAIPTGLAMELPPGYEAQVRPRSGLAMKHGVTVLNSPGTIDSDYRGEVRVLLVNLGSEPFVVRRGERIAQLVVQPVLRAELKLVAETSATRRGAGGFGSTGVASAGPGARGRAKSKPARAGLPNGKAVPTSEAKQERLALNRPGGGSSSRR